MVKLLRYFKLLLVSFILLGLSSCAIHNKFPYICFLPGCVKNQLGITDAKNKGKVLKKERIGKRKKRKIKRENRRNKTEGGITSVHHPHETNEEKINRKKEEKATAELAANREQKKQDSLAAIAEANKKYIDPLAGQNQVENKTVSGDSLIIYYPLNSDTLSLPDKERLKKYIEELKQKPYNKLKILGYTDNSGTLSESRAKKVREYLIEYGLPKSKLFIEDKGSKNPNYDNATDDGRRLNRRVVILLQ